MTDVYIAYAREDRERLRLITEMLRFEGWDLWMDPFDLSDEPSPAAELKLASARVILTFWSERSRTSEIVRSEAATGLYKNKLMQVRVDGGAPPRPFDQVESLDFSYWRGDIDDPMWRRLIAGLKQHAGEPAGTRAVAPPLKRAPGAGADAPPAPSFPPSSTVTPVLRPYSPPPAATREPRPTPKLVPPPPPPAPPEPPLELRPVFQAPPSPPVYQAPPPPPPIFQAPPPPLPLPPVYQPPPSPVYQTPQPPPPVYQPPPSPPLRAPLLSGAEPSEQPWRRSGGALTYAEPKSGMGLGAIGAAAILIVSGVGLWFGDPFGWRTAAGPGESDPIAMAARTVGEATIANGEPATAVIEDTEESNANWTRVNRKSPEALRDFVTEYPRASTAETARSLLRVLDAQSWVTAVTADSETAYEAYLKRFPAEGVAPGAMAAAARERLGSLTGERQQAIAEIQRGLANVNLYAGPIDGKSSSATTQAMARFASSNRRAAPSLSSSSPRELRGFAEAVGRVGSPGVASAEVSAAVEADRLRVAQAQAQAASLAAAPIASNGEADSLALGQQERLAESQAWDAAKDAGTVKAYQSYLAAWPNSANATAARAALTKLNRPAPYSIDLLTADVRAVVDASRRAQTTAIQKAAAARQAAAAAEGLTDARSIVGSGGDRYVAQIASGAPNGLGVRVRGSGVNSGDRYRGELRNGQSSGLGVYEFSDNPGNAGARALRYEGEHSGDAASGYGMFYWRSGDSFAGSGAGSDGQARGVLTYANGQRYEGDLVSGQRNGFGVVWADDGTVAQAGRWSKDQLAEPMKAPVAQQ
jgi:hypothetical protein